MREVFNFDLDGLVEFRAHTFSILADGLVEHTPRTIAALRNHYSEHDVGHQQELDFIEAKINRFGAMRPANRPRLHAEILASVAAVMRVTEVEAVIDIGCGEGLLLRALAHEARIKRIVGVDCDAVQIGAASTLLSELPTVEREKITVTATDTLGAWKLLPEGRRAISAAEVIEHIADTNWIRSLFELGPDVLVATTPNRDFNVLYPKIEVLGGLLPTGFRHPDHQFELTRNEFYDWAHMHAGEYGYTANLLPIGPSDMEHGSSAQMAVFQKTHR